MNKMTQAWVKPNVEGRIAAHVRAWDQLKRVGVLRVVDELPFITISREFGCEALPLAQRLATVLNQRHQPAVQWVAYDREVLER